MRRLRLAKAFALFVVVMGLTGTGVSGYTLANLSSYLTPVNQASEYLSNINLPPSVSINLSSASQNVKGLADSLSDCVSVLLVCVTDLRSAKQSLYSLAASLTNIQADTGLEGLQSQLRQTGAQLYQVNTFVTYVVVFLIGASLLFAICGVVLVVLILHVERLERQLQLSVGRASQ